MVLRARHEAGAPKKQSSTVTRRLRKVSRWIATSARRAARLHARKVEFGDDVKRCNGAVSDTRVGGAGTHEIAIHPWRARPPSKSCRKACVRTSYRSMKSLNVSPDGRDRPPHTGHGSEDVRAQKPRNPQSMITSRFRAGTCVT